MYRLCGLRNEPFSLQICCAIFVSSPRRLSSSHRPTHTHVTFGKKGVNPKCESVVKKGFGVQTLRVESTQGLLLGRWRLLAQVVISGGTL